MFHYEPPSTTRSLNRKKAHQHHESKKWVRLPANEKCLECYPVHRPFLETTLGRLPPEIRAVIFKDVLKVGSLSPRKHGKSASMVKSRPQVARRPAGPSSCLALLRTCRQIYHETSFLVFTLNTFHFSKPQDLLPFLRGLGTERCDELRSLHLEDMLVQRPRYSQSELESIRSRYTYNEGTLAHLASLVDETIHENVNKALQLLNKRGNLQKIYLDIRPSQTLNYIKLCTKVHGFQMREILFASPTRWSVMAPTTWRWSWYFAFLDSFRDTDFRDKPYYAYWAGDEKYRVEVDILPVLPERKGIVAASMASE